MASPMPRIPYKSAVFPDFTNHQKEKNQIRDDVTSSLIERVPSYQRADLTIPGKKKNVSFASLVFFFLKKGKYAAFVHRINAYQMQPH